MRRNKGLLLLAIVLIIGGLLVFYFSYYYGKEGEKLPAVQGEVMDREEIAEEAEAVTAGKKTEEVSGEQGVEDQATDVEDECGRMEKELMEVSQKVLCCQGPPSLVANVSTPSSSIV